MSSFTYNGSLDYDPMKLFQLVNPDRGFVTCVGYAPSKGRRCQCQIARHNHQSALLKLSALPPASSDSQTLLALLRKAAERSLCVRFHQGQAAEVAQRWYRIYRDRDNIEGLRERLDLLDEELARRERELEALLLQRQQQQRQQREAETRRHQEEAHRRREEERRQREEEECRQREEDERRQREEEERLQQEEESRQESRRQAERERAEQEAEARARAQARAERERLRQEREEATRQRIEREWAESWTRYDRDWDRMQRVNTADFDEDVRESVPWPVKSGRWQDVNEANVRAFLRQAPDGVASNPRRFRSLLRRQALRWHEDRLRHWFPRIAGNSAALELATTVMQVINGLTGDLSSL